MAAYKRTGFFWDVGPWPLLRNFMPAILQMPCTRYFFDKHDWYRTLQGYLTHVPDDEQGAGLNVFIYRFDSGDDQLTVWADREARRITAVDTAEVFVAATIDHAAMEAVLAWTVDVIAAWEKEEKKKW